MSLSPQLLAYRHNRMNGQSRYKAAISAGFSVNMAMRASRLDAVIKASLNEILEKEGMDNKFLADQIKSGLTATRITVDKNGTIHENPDHFIRHKYLETLLKITGKMEQSKSSDDQSKNLPSLIIQTLNLNVDQRKIVDVVR